MKEKIRKYIIENFIFDGSEGNLSDTDSLLEKGIIDSTGILELVMFLEENLGIGVNDEDLVPENLDSINNILDFINSKKVA